MANVVIWLSNIISSYISQTLCTQIFSQSLCTYLISIGPLAGIVIGLVLAIGGSGTHSLFGKIGIIVFSISILFYLPLIIH